MQDIRKILWWLFAVTSLLHTAVFLRCILAWSTRNRFAGEAVNSIRVRHAGPLARRRLGKAHRSLARRRVRSPRQQPVEVVVSASVYPSAAMGDLIIRARL